MANADISEGVQAILIDEIPEVTKVVMEEASLDPAENPFMYY